MSWDYLQNWTNIKRLFCSKNKIKKKPVFIFYIYIYNFYFEDLIYKWIKQSENQQESGLIFFAMFQIHSKSELITKIKAKKKKMIKDVN